MLGPLELLLNANQSLSSAWIVGPDAWEKQTLQRHNKCRTEP